MAISESHASHIGRVKVTYSISGVQLDPDDLTAKIGVVPTRMFRRGEPRLNYNKDKIGTHEEGVWEVSSERISSKDVNDHFDAVLALLIPHAKLLRTLADQGEAYFGVLWESSYLYAGTGPFLSPQSIAGPAALGAGVGFDIYQIDEAVSKRGAEG